MSDFALLDSDNVVIAVVAWDGNPDTWPPPAEAVAWVDVSDPDFFVEVGGTLDPETMVFERGVAPELTPAELEVLAPFMPKPPEVDALLAKLTELGVLTPEDVDEVLGTPFGGDRDRQ